MPTLELNGKPFAEQTGTGEPVLKGNLNFEGPIRINNQEVLSANGSISTSAAVFEGSSANAIVRITQTGTGNALVVEDSANPDSTPFVVDSAGRLLSGTSSPFNNFRDVQTTVDRTPSMQFSGVNAPGAGFSQVVWKDTSTGAFYSPTHWLARSGSSTPGTNALVPSEAPLGVITFAGDDGTRFLNAAYITAAVDGTPGANDMPGRLVFSTTADGSSSPTERMRIDSSGNVGLTGGGTLSFYSGASVVGSIVPSSIGTTYNTTSDFRLKDNIQPISDGTEKLMAMNPVSHTWKADPEAPSVHGFIAQEMVNIIPEAVSGTPDGEEMMTMDYGRITPVLVAALQDAHKKIKELENRLNTLESN